MPFTSFPYAKKTIPTAVTRPANPINPCIASLVSSLPNVLTVYAKISKVPAMANKPVFKPFI